MPDADSVGKRLQQVRTRKSLTLDQLAERAGLSKSFLWEVEHDKSGISGEKLLRVANVLGASLDFLLRGEPAPENYQPPAIEIPRELSEVAEELGLSYRQTLALLDVERSIVARRSLRTKRQKTKDEWRALHEGVKQFLEDSP